MSDEKQQVNILKIRDDYRPVEFSADLTHGVLKERNIDWKNIADDRQQVSSLTDSADNSHQRENPDGL